MSMDSDVPARVATAASLGLAGLPWVSNMELALRLIALVLSIVASWYAIVHFRKPPID